METYSISVICHNCHHVPMNDYIEREPGPDPKQISIPKGTEVQTFLREMVCENCDCEGFMGIN
jgi:hypothetical protein